MLNANHKGGHKSKQSGKGNKPSKALKPKFDTAQLFKAECGVFRRLCQAVNTPFANSQLENLDAGRWEAIANAPMPDTETDSFPDDYLIQQVMRKNPRLPLGIDKKKVAIDKFLVTEQSCLQTNELLLACSRDEYRVNTACLAIPPGIVKAIRDEIKRILGPLDKEALKAIEEGTRFGPGATFHCSGRDLTPGKKLVSPIGLTSSLIKYVGSIEPYGWLQSTRGYSLTRGSRACTVRKDATTDRFIAIEPSLNMRWQLGIGAHMRRRLKDSTHIDLKHQADVNRHFAMRAIYDLLATIDLASASDSIAIMVIKFFFPKDWVHLLLTFRSPEMQLQGKWHTLEKISSMGNGFTFELETILFYSIARAFCDKPQVFGDDIIVPQAAAADVIRTLNILGFSVNGKKTFLAGSFFESCGVDVWRGHNVRPFFLKKDEETHDFTSAIIRMANAIRRYSNRRGLGLYCDSRFLPVWLYAISRDKDARSTYGPEGYGDEFVVRDFDECSPARLPHGYQGWKANGWTRRPMTKNVTNRSESVYASIADKSNQLVNYDLLGRRLLCNSRLLKSTLGLIDISQALPAGRLKRVVDKVTGEYRWTYGPRASQTFESVRGRLSDGKLQDVPVFDWSGLGPWE